MSSIYRRHDWTGYTVHITRQGEVSLRTPSGRSIGWVGKGHDTDQAAADWLRIYRGTTLTDRRPAPVTR